MTTEEQNERLTRIGPGTPMGELMRRYWQPFLPAAKLIENPVQKVRLLGEDLVCYKDRSGNLGLIGDRCAHRLVGMHFGIPEEHGLRCPYHGWCYESDGQCIETPLESPNSRMKDGIKLKAYPVQELGGLLFAYMGPQPAPLLPPWDFYVWPNAIRQIGYTVLPCNWLQVHENSHDPAHAIYLHGHYFQYEIERLGHPEDQVDPEERRAFMRAITSADGLDHVIAQRDSRGVQKAVVFTKSRGAREDHIRWHQYTIFPNLTRFAHYTTTEPNHTLRHLALITVPVDDTHTYQFDYNLYVAPQGVTAPPQEFIPYYECDMPDPDAPSPLVNVQAQDLAVWASQGDITDRSKEHLGVTDEAIRELRELIEEQIQLIQAGNDPINVYRDQTEIGNCVNLAAPIADWWESELTPQGQYDYARLYATCKGFADYARIRRGTGDGFAPLVELASQIVSQIKTLADAQSFEIDNSASKAGDEARVTTS